MNSILKSVFLFFFKQITFLTGFNGNIGETVEYPLFMFKVIAFDLVNIISAVCIQLIVCVCVFFF